MAGRVLIAVMFVAPVPLGSNRPVFWALWALVLGLVFSLYCFELGRSGGGKLRMPLSSAWPVAIPFVGVAAFMLFQMIPAGSFTFMGQTGATFESASASLVPGDTFLALLRWLSYGVLFFLAAQAGVRKNRARRITLFLTGIVTLQALYAIVALLYLGDGVLFIEKSQYMGDATGTFVNRNSFATFIGFGAIIAALLALPPSADEPGVPPPQLRGVGQRSGQAKLKFRLSSSQVLAATAFIIMIAALAASNSRMGLFATGCGLVTAILLRLSSLRGRLTGLVFLVSGALAMIAIYGQGTLERSLAVERDADTRIAVYENTLDMIRDRPLLGFGASSFEAAYPLYNVMPKSTAVVYDRAHSTYLAHWSELGVIFGSLPMMIIAVIMASLLGASLRRGNRQIEICAAAGAVVLGAVHSLVDFSLEIEAVTFLFVIILGLGYAGAREVSARSTAKGGS
ncbi:O-antigen ligase family protein [Pannonibacter phragmitetus]|uniref:O-antigen ligase family protein n=1 Tax=Pannonibacter phragmitetus TaxID=121719 RepID=UPI003D2EEAF6